MLQAMQKKVQEEGETEEKLYKQFSCYCEKGGADLSASISAAETKVPAVGLDIEAAENKLTQTKEALKAAQADRSAAKAAVAEATALREKEAAAFAAEKADYDSNLAALKKAIAALEKGVAGAFLQTGAAQALRQLLAQKQDMLDADRQELVAFLSGKQGAGYAPSSGEVIGILKQLAGTMAGGLGDATSTEEAAIKQYDGLVAAKSKEIEALASSIEKKTREVGELGVSIVQMKEDLSDTEAALAQDEEFLAGLEKGCAAKKAEWEERSKTRSEELVALAETIKVLNDDDALDLFKKTLPSPSASFVQLGASASALRARALAAVRGAQRAAGAQQRAGLDLLVLALSGKKALSQGGFDKVIAMCDAMVEVLKREQLDDDHKKEECATQFDFADDKKKVLQRAVADEDQAIAAAEDGIAKLAEEIAALEAGIKALDKSVAEATEDRKEENAEYKDLMASDGAAKELLAFAKNRLNAFYNKKLHKPAPKAELSAEDRIYSSLGGTVTTAPPGGIAGTGIAVLAQVSAHSQRRDAPAPPPETWDAYAKKSEESAGVIAMLDLLIKDLDKEITEARVEETDAQADYESLMKDSAAKRVADSKALSEKAATKADVQGALEGLKGHKASTAKELMATMKYTQALHASCDWLMEFYDQRKEARAGEIDSLKQAKAVLSGADYSFAQTGARRLRRRLQ